MKHASIMLASVACFSTSAQAGSWAQCVGITDNKTRLACFDSLAESKENRATQGSQHNTADATTSAKLPEQQNQENTPSTTEATSHALNQRIQDQDIASENPFSMRAYKPNYILPVTYTSTNLNNSVYDFKPQHTEAKFQFSFQFDWWNAPLEPDTAFYFAYTQLSLWQMYNGSASSPFRETNYEPEIGLDITTDKHIAGLDFRKVRASFIHQSNGQGDARSRSWNRLALQTAFGRGNFAGAVRAWYRIPESPAKDDNPDITKYLGFGDLVLAYKFPVGTLSTTVRNNLRSNNRGSVELDYSFPLSKHLKGYVQYFNGYGESLIDYNRSINRIGIGFALTDWL